ncbi:site-specific integrase [Salinifilum aidingensis]
MGTVTALHAEPPREAPPAQEVLAAFAEHLRTTRQAGGTSTAEQTIRSYTTALGRLVDDQQPVHRLDAQVVQHRFRQQWGQASASTWNARRAALRAFSDFLREQGWSTGDLAAGIDRASLPRAQDRSRRRGDIERLLSDQRHALRDRVLWRLLYDTAARAEEILALNVDDLDLRNRQATTTRKGGVVDRVTWSPSTARALARLLGTRRRGPVFLTHRRAKGTAHGAVADHDLDPDTERGRLGYDAALKTFKAATGGWTLHDLRHSALTHGAEDGLAVTTLMVKSGHQDVRTLARYARPSTERAQRQWEHARGE